MSRGERWLSHVPGKEDVGARGVDGLCVATARLKIVESLAADKGEVPRGHELHGVEVGALGYLTNAISLTGPSFAPLIFSGAAIAITPEGGTSDRFATFSSS